jgi:glycosyltransferase involved in cell wall biosynthesis
MFAHVYIEALASGLPIVSTATIGANQIVIPEVGLIAPKGDWARLAECILSITTDKEVLLKMSKSARKYFEENYDMEIIIKRCLVIYKDVLRIKKK